MAPLIDMPADGSGTLLVQIVAIVGALWILSCACGCFGCLWRQCFRCERNLKKRYAGASWAAVTGATSGIGEGFVFELAKRGFNVLLISRSQAKLDAVAAAVKAAYPGVSTRTCVASFGGTGDDTAMWERVSKAVVEQPLAILVNNVGCKVHMCRLYQTDTAGFPTTADLVRMIEINCTVGTRLTALVGRHLVTSGRRGGIINVSSLAAEGPGNPLAAVYAGSKAYTKYFSKSVTAEVESKGVDCTTIVMGPVQTPMLLSAMPNNPFKAASTVPRVAASNSLCAMSWGDIEAYCHWKHAAMAFVMGMSTGRMARQQMIKTVSKLLAADDHAPPTAAGSRL